MAHSNKERPEPDALLQAINREQKHKQGGRLYLFLGMAPGVGKTYAMLMAGHEALKDGLDVVAGVVESHNRKETEFLLQGLTLVPKKQIEYRGISLEEMDLDAVLKRKPKIVLVDELAHTNVPSSRHAKRWQDIDELLDAGIDVYSTMNVQHLESRKEMVEQITGIKVQELVPDSVLDRAFQIRLIDLSPTDLLKRLKEGKVYLGDKADLAATNFFKEQNLTALREISLRIAAERVDYDLQTFTDSHEAGTPWGATERLMVVVDHHVESEELIRTTRRLAYSLEAQWIAVYIDTDIMLSESEKKTLTKNLELSRSLGAVVLNLSSTDIVQTIIRVARQKSVTQIIIGRRNKRGIRDLIDGGSVLERLIREASDIDVHIVKIEPTDESRAFAWRHYFSFHSPLRSYLKALWLVLALTLGSQLSVAIVGYRPIGFLFLLGVICLGLFVSLGPILFAAILSVLVWDYFFIPPIGTFLIREPEDIFLCFSYLFSALAIGILTRKIKAQQDMMERRESRNRLLHEVVWDIAIAPSRNEMLASVCERVGKFINGQCDVAFKKRDGSLRPFEQIQFANLEREMGVAKWVYDNGKPGGWSTETLSASEAFYIPMKSASGTVGVLAFRSNRKMAVSPEDLDLLFTVARQLAMSQEREFFREQAQETARLKETKKLQQTILQYISDELRGPLSQIGESVDKLTGACDTLDGAQRADLSEKMVTATEKLRLIIENLTAVSRIAAGIFPLLKQACGPKQLVEEAKKHIERNLVGHPVSIQCEADLPVLQVEVGLCEQVIANVLLNAAMYSPLNAPIEVGVKRVDDTVCVMVSDEGPGIPEADMGRIFDKFYRVPGTISEGAGLGLAVARGVMRAHGGRITVKNKPTGGVTFTLIFQVVS